MGRKPDYHYQQILIVRFCHTAPLLYRERGDGRGDVRQDGCINLLYVEHHHHHRGGRGGAGRREGHLNNNHQLLYVDIYRPGCISAKGRDHTNLSLNNSHYFAIFSQF